LPNTKLNIVYLDDIEPSSFELSEVESFVQKDSKQSNSLDDIVPLLVSDLLQERKVEISL
jgi:hypothetical protein